MLADALRMYVQDHDGIMPPDTTFFTLSGKLFNYVNFRSIWHKPDSMYLVCPIWNAIDIGSKVRYGWRYGYGWNYHLAGKTVISLHLSDSVPVIFDREPWHGRMRNAVSFSGKVFMTTDDVPIHQLSAEELRRYAYPSQQVSMNLREFMKSGRWKKAETAYRRAIQQAGGNARFGYEFYEELIAVQCKLGKLRSAQATLQEMKRECPYLTMTIRCQQMIENAERGISPDMKEFQLRLWAMYRW